MSLLRLLILILSLGLLAAPGGLWAQATDTGTEAPTVETPTPEVPASETPAPVPVQPTQTTGPDYAAWERVALRAEAAVEVGRASTSALEELRAELTKWRESFSVAQTENKVRIDTLKNQINTLGPVPAEGESEPEILTQRRAELTAQLAAAQAPVVAAEEAFRRADGLIREIDGIIRNRQAEILLTMGPSPLNPANWTDALAAATGTLTRLWGEVAKAWTGEAQRAALARDAPRIILELVLGLVLLARARIWIGRAARRTLASGRMSARSAKSFLVSLVQLAAPIAGVYVLVEALTLMGALGLRGQVIAVELPLVGLCIFGAHWLGGRIFGTSDACRPLLQPNPPERPDGRRAVLGLGILLALTLLLSRIAVFEGFSEATIAVLNFPVTVLAGLFLLRTGRVLRAHARAEGDGTDGQGFLRRTLNLVARVVMALAVLGPLAAAVGYGALAESFLFPTALTLALMAMLAILHILGTDLYALITGRSEDEAQNALIPVLISFALILMSLPVLALIWGARIADLTELWARASQGVAVGETRISPSDFFIFLIVFGIGFALTRLIQGMLRSTVLPKTKIDQGGRTAITSGVGYVGLFLAALIAISSAGLDLSSIALVAGALSVGIGFGLQNIVSNFVSGIILLIERPISEGDWIEVGGSHGTVKEISVRSTRIETFDRSELIVPNADLVSSVVTNYTRGNAMGRIIVPVGVAYGSDTRKVEEILKEIADAHPLVMVHPEPSVLFRGFGADSMDFEIRAILSDVNFSLSAKSDMNHEIARRFGEEGIEVPFAQRDIWIRNPEALTARPPVSEDET